MQQASSQLFGDDAAVRQGLDALAGILASDITRPLPLMLFPTGDQEADSSWRKAWSELVKHTERQQRATAEELVQRLVELADSHEDLDVRQQALDALACIPLDALQGCTALHELLRKLLLELPDAPSQRTVAKQRRALMIAALLAAGAAAGAEEAQPGSGALLSWCVHKLVEVLRLGSARPELLPVALWACAALAGRQQWGRLEAAGVVKVGWSGLV